MTEAKELDPAALEVAWQAGEIALKAHVGNDMGIIQRTALMQVVTEAVIPAYLEALSTAPVALEVSEERGWLIELRGHVPTWFALDAAEGEHGWTNDSLKALRFGRKADADAYISDIGWTEAFASEHSWSDSSPRRHVWWEWHNLTCCKTCGIVRRADGGNDNGVCKGAAKIGLRSAIHPAPSREAVIDRAAIIEECAAIVRRHRPDASFDDSSAGYMERHALLDNVANEILALRSLPSNAPSLGEARLAEGEAIVPREPTPEQLRAGMDDLGWWVEPYVAPRESGVPIDSDMSAEDAAKINAQQIEVIADLYRAMLAAAPNPSHVQAEAGEARC